MVEVDTSQGKHEGNKQDQTVGVTCLWNREKGVEPSWNYYRCAYHCATYTGVVGKINSQEPTPEDKHKRLVSLVLPIMGQTVLAE